MLPVNSNINVVGSVLGFPSRSSVQSRSLSILITVFGMGTDVSCLLGPPTKLYFMYYDS